MFNSFYYLFSFFVILFIPVIAQLDKNDTLFIFYFTALMSILGNTLLLKQEGQSSSLRKKNCTWDRVCQLDTALWCAHRGGRFRRSAQGKWRFTRTVSGCYMTDRCLQCPCSDWYCTPTQSWVTDSLTTGPPLALISLTCLIKHAAEPSQCNKLATQVREMRRIKILSLNVMIGVTSLGYMEIKIFFLNVMIGDTSQGDMED